MDTTEELRQATSIRGIHEFEVYVAQAGKGGSYPSVPQRMVHTDWAQIRPIERAIHLYIFLVLSKNSKYSFYCALVT